MDKKMQLRLKEIFLTLCLFRISKGLKKLKDIPHELTIDIFHAEKEKELGVMLTLNLGDPEASESSEYPFDLKISYIGIFEFKKRNQTEELLKQIGAVNCAAIIYPFLRETISNLVLKSLHRSYLLPPINFVKFFEKFKNDPDIISFQKVNFKENLD